jgi:hypothetical protein
MAWNVRSGERRATSATTPGRPRPPASGIPRPRAERLRDPIEGGLMTKVVIDMPTSLGGFVVCLFRPRLLTGVPSRTWDTRGSATLSPRRRRARGTNGYVNAGTFGHTRAPPWTQEQSISRRNVSACARAWTPVLHASFPRNEGVPGSSPGVGFRPICRYFCHSGQRRDGSGGPSGYETGTSGTPSQVMKWSPSKGQNRLVCRHFVARVGMTTAVPAMPACPHGRTRPSTRRPSRRRGAARQ